MSQPPWTADQRPAPRRGLSLSVGAALGTFVGLLGPVILALIAWVADNRLSDDDAGTVITAMVVAVLALPVVLLVAGCILVFPDVLRGWGVACLVAAGVWLISGAGVCTVFFFGALASAEGIIG